MRRTGLSSGDGINSNVRPVSAVAAFSASRPVPVSVTVVVVPRRAAFGLTAVTAGGFGLATSPVAALTRRTAPVNSPNASCWPSGDRAADGITSACGAKTLTSRRVAAVHDFTDPSSPTVYNTAPFGPTRTRDTAASWANTDAVSLPPSAVTAHERRLRSTPAA